MKPQLHTAHYSRQCSSDASFLWFAVVLTKIAAPYFPCPAPPATVSSQAACLSCITPACHSPRPSALFPRSSLSSPSPALRSTATGPRTGVPAASPGQCYASADPARQLPHAGRHVCTLPPWASLAPALPHTTASAGPCLVFFDPIDCCLLTLPHATPDPTAHGHQLRRLS